MSYYVKAFISYWGPGYPTILEACVSYHQTLHEATIEAKAHQKKYPNVSFYIQDGDYPYWEVDNCEYQDILEKVNT